MGKSKVKAAAPQPTSKTLSSVKEGRVTKPSQTPKAKSKDVAKTVAAAREKPSKKSKKAPTPEPESESSESDPDDEDSSLASEDDSDIEEDTKAISAKGSSALGGEASEQDSDTSEDDSDASEDEAVPATKTAAKTNGVAPKLNGTVKSATEADLEDAGTSDESDSSEDDDSDLETKAPAAKALNGAKVNGTAKKADAKKSKGDAGSNSDSGSDSDSDASSDEEIEKVAKVEDNSSKKRKAEVAPEPILKKSKTVDTSAEDGASKNLFVGNLSWNVDEEWLQREFAEFGEITGCRLISDRDTGRSKGFGYVEFASAEAAKNALENMKGTELDGRPLNVDFSTPRPANDGGNQRDRTNQRASKYGDQRSAPSDTLFVGNISFNADEDTIRNAFSEYGTLTRVSLPTDVETGAPKGFGYVGFSSVDEAQAALEALNGYDVGGRALRLDFATPRSNDGGFPRGGGGGGGRGRGRGGFGDRGGRGGFNDRGGRGRGGFRGGRGSARGGSTNRGGFGDFKGSRVTF